MVVVIFRTWLKSGADQDALAALTREMRNRVRTLSGFVSIKEFQAADGEGVAVAEFETMDAVKTWREHPDHRRAQERGREEFFSRYRVQVGEVVRDYTFAE